MRYEEHEQEPTFTVELTLEELRFLFAAHMTTGTEDYQRILREYLGEEDPQDVVQDRRDRFEAAMRPLWVRVEELCTGMAPEHDEEVSPPPSQSWQEKAREES